MILQTGDPILRQTAKPVPDSDFGGRKLETIIQKMFAALANEEDGVALAAPQIGVSLRLFVVSARGVNESLEKSLVCINPELIRSSRKKIYLEEGCLSVRSVYGWVKRSEKVTLLAFDQQGKKFIYHASGLLSQIFQHEIDHLDGILFTDKAEKIND